jgi:hypothetical protein
LTPLIFSPFGIKHQKGKKRRKINTHSSSPCRFFQSTSSPPVALLPHAVAPAPPPPSLSEEDTTVLPWRWVVEEWWVHRVLLFLKISKVVLNLV